MHKLLSGQSSEHATRFYERGDRPIGCRTSAAVVALVIRFVKLLTCLRKDVGGRVS